MRVRVHRQTLLRACQLASESASRRKVSDPSVDRRKYGRSFDDDVSQGLPPHPILSHFLITSDGARLTVLAQNDDTSMRAHVPVLQSAGPPDRVLVNGRRLTGVLSTVPAEEVDVHTQAGHFFVSGVGREANFSLPTHPNPAQFPDVPVFPTADYHALKADDFGHLIHRTAFCCHPRSERYSMMGVLLVFSGPSVRGAASDGRHMAVTDVPAVQVGRHDTSRFSCVVPSRSLNYLKSCLKKGSDEVHVHATPTGILFKVDRFTLFSRLLEGPFAPYEKVLEQRTPDFSRVSVSAGELLACLRMASSVNRDDVSRVVMHATPAGVSLSSSGDGEATVRLDTFYQGPDVRIAFNPEFPLEMLARVPADTTFSLHFKGNSSPLFLTEEGYTYTVMPLVDLSDQAAA
jgi:DNA polymerase III subunit beta